MGCFSLPIRTVSSTHIFARPLADDRQLLVYGMTVEITEDVAMILPIPVPSGSREDAVKFVDLSGCPGFFDELESLFPAAAPAVRAVSGPDVPRVAPLSPLMVHEVGDFEASFVPTPSDFARLDARFRLPNAVWDQLPRYHDWGFCVFKLKTKRRPSGFFGLFKGKPEGETRRIHPMAFEFPRRDPTSLFYPTVHVHDGEVHPTADFDHALYCQIDSAWEPLMDWQRSTAKSDALLGAREWLAPAAWLYKRVLRGELPNRDNYLVEARLRARAAVHDLFRVRMCATCAHLVDDGKTELEPHVKKWMRVSEAERVRIRDAMSSELGAVFASRVAAWGVKPFVHDDPDWVVFTAQNDRIEPQEVHVAFETAPSAAIREEMQCIVQGALDRATG